MKQPEPMPEAVIKSVNAKYPEVAIRDVKWDSLNGCYYFYRAGMYHGVELDGYIHT